jgi:hypothetical protein
MVAPSICRLNLELPSIRCLIAIALFKWHKLHQYMIKRERELTILQKSRTIKHVLSEDKSASDTDRRQNQYQSVAIGAELDVIRCLCLAARY